jgi:hypothetical protein
MGVVVGAIRDVRNPHDAWATVEFDTFSVSLGIAVIAGGLALLAPFLDSLTAALVALAGAGWAAGLPRHGARAADWARPARVGGILALGIGTVAFFALPGPFDIARGLALSVSFVPLWLVERRAGLRRPERLAEAP